MEEELTYEYWEPVKKSYKIYGNKHEYIDFVKTRCEAPKNLTGFVREDIYADYELNIDISKLNKTQLKKLERLTKGSTKWIRM